MCRRIWSSKTSALARIPSTFAAMAEPTYIPKYFMRHVCAPKFCLLLTAVMSNDVGAAAEYLSTPRPIIGWHQARHAVSTGYRSINWKRFYTQTLLHMVLLHKHTLTHRRFDTQKPLHTNAFTHRRFYTQTLLHTDAFTHRRFYTQKLLHTDGFTHRRFYTQVR